MSGKYDGRCGKDLVSKMAFSSFILSCLKAVGYFEQIANEDLKTISNVEMVVAKLITRLMCIYQFNTKSIDVVFDNRLMLPDGTRRAWKPSHHFEDGEYIESLTLSGAVYTTLAGHIPHSCDPNILCVNRGDNCRLEIYAYKPIKKGDEMLDTFGPLFYHMSRDERQTYLKKSYWMGCHCNPCVNNWPEYAKLPRHYSQLPQKHFVMGRCDRKYLQKEVLDFKKKIVDISKSDEISESEIVKEKTKVFIEWSDLLYKLVKPPHQDFIHLSRGIRTCIWLSGRDAFCLSVKEDENLKQAKIRYNEKKKLNKSKRRHR